MEYVKGIEKIIGDCLSNTGFPGQNSGGCGIFAKETYTLFNKLGIECSIVASYGDYQPEAYYSFLKECIIDDCNDEDLVPNHVAVKAFGFIFDADGYYDEGGYWWNFNIDLQESELDFILESDGWSCCYDTSNNTQLKVNFINTLSYLQSRLEQLKVAV